MIVRTCCIAALTLAAPSLAAAAEQSANPPQVDELPPLLGENLAWDRQPTGEDFARVYPDHAAHRGFNGRALLNCRINEERRVDTCVVVEEAPAEYGFGDAAILLARKLRLKPGQDEATVGRAVLLKIRFILAHY